LLKPSARLHRNSAQTVLEASFGKDMDAGGSEHYSSFQEGFRAEERALAAAQAALEHVQQQNVASKAALASSEATLAAAEEGRQSTSLAKAEIEEKAADSLKKLAALRGEQRSLQAAVHRAQLSLCDAECRLEVLQEEHRAATVSSTKEAPLTKAIDHMRRESVKGGDPLID
jgi:chromosome segregation ATPase